MTLKIKTTWGTIEVERVDGKVCRCVLPFLSAQPVRPFALINGRSGIVPTFISAVFGGEKVKPPELGPLKGTAFQQQVWQAIAEIPVGQTKTYGELAKAIGRPTAVRAVGSACGKNPVPLFIPCHRVVGSTGGGGFSAGLPWKKRLLSGERSHSDLDQQGLHPRNRWAK